MKGLVPMLPVRSMATSVEFYRKLGFSVDSRNDEWGWAKLSHGDFRLMVDQSLNVHPQAPRQAVIYLYPADVTKYHAQVRAHEVPAPDLRMTFYGMKEFRVHDPDGNELWIGETVSSPT